MKLDVPYYSQRLDVKDKFWAPRACGIVALAMAMDYQTIQREPYLPKPLLVKEGKGVRFSFPRPYQGGARGGGFLMQLIHEGQAIGAHDPKYGWVHDGLVAVAQKHGFTKSFRKEWSFEDTSTEIKIQKVLAYMIVLLQNGIPVLASMKHKSGGHLVLLVGFTYLDAKHLSGFYFHDPDSRSRTVGAYKFISTKNFLKLWKRRIVVVK